MAQTFQQLQFFQDYNNTLLAIGVTTTILLAIFGLYKLILLLIHAQFGHPSTAEALDAGQKNFNSPHDSGYASSDEEDDPELSSLRRSIQMCEEKPRTPHVDREAAFEVFADFARVSTGSRSEGVGLGMNLNAEKDDGKP